MKITDQGHLTMQMTFCFFDPSSKMLKRIKHLVFRGNTKILTYKHTSLRRTFFEPVQLQKRKMLRYILRGNFLCFNNKLGFFLEHSYFICKISTTFKMNFLKIPIICSMLYYLLNKLLKQQKKISLLITLKYIFLKLWTLNFTFTFASHPLALAISLKHLS